MGSLVVEDGSGRRSSCKQRNGKQRGCKHGDGKYCTVVVNTGMGSILVVSV